MENVFNKAPDAYPRLLIKGFGLKTTTTPSKIKMKTCLD